MVRRRSVVLVSFGVALALSLFLIEVFVVSDPAPAPAQPTSRTAAAGPLRVSAQNGRYFATPDGRPVLLTGSHTWQNFQDTGPSDPPKAFDYPAYLDFLQRENHNFFRLWVWEQSRFSNEIKTDDYYTTPVPYLRAGSQSGMDGAPRFDLDQFNPEYFTRLRNRVEQAGQRGIYVAVMLFNGWSIEGCKGDQCENNPWKGHPFNKANNVNGVDGDKNANGSGEETQTLDVPAVTARQEAYVRKVVDTVGDLDNVLYEISNEAPTNSAPWQYHMIDHLKAYQSGRAKTHPVGMTSTYPDGDNENLWRSPADWISPNGDVSNPPPNSGSKVVLSDTDHLCGLCGDSSWPWKSFISGENPIYMDAYDGGYGIGGDMRDSTAVAIRANLGRVRDYAGRLDLTAVTPQPSLSSTGFCLAGPGKYLVYASGGSFTVDLGKSRGQTLNGQWLSPDTGQTVPVTGVRAEGSASFTAPFDGPGVLLLTS